MHTNIYISDLLSVPMPKYATSHRDYLRRIMFRRLVWAILPGLGKTVIGLAACGLTMGGIVTLALGFGG